MFLNVKFFKSTTWQPAQQLLMNKKNNLMSHKMLIVWYIIKFSISNVKVVNSV